VITRAPTRAPTGLLPPAALLPVVAATGVALSDAAGDAWPAWTDGLAELEGLRAAFCFELGPAVPFVPAEEVTGSVPLLEPAPLVAPPASWEWLADADADGVGSAAASPHPVAG
jgi:hypothetical protein